MIPATSVLPLDSQVPGLGDQPSHKPEDGRGRSYESEKKVVSILELHYGALISPCAGAHYIGSSNITQSAHPSIHASQYTATLLAECPGREGLSPTGLTEVTF